MVNEFALASLAAALSAHPTQKDIESYFQLPDQQQAIVEQLVLEKDILPERIQKILSGEHIVIDSNGQTILISRNDIVSSPSRECYPMKSTDPEAEAAAVAEKPVSNVEIVSSPSRETSTRE